MSARACGQGEQAWVGASVRGQGVLEALDCDLRSFRHAAIAMEHRARCLDPARSLTDLFKFDHLFDRLFDLPVSLLVSL